MNEINRRELMQSAGVLGASAIGANQFIDTTKAQSDGPTNEISGVVETESGPLENATVVAVPHDISQPVLETTTDSNGEYIFTESDLIEGDNLYIVVAYAGTESTPLRSEQNYPFVAATGMAPIPDSGVAQYRFEQDITDSYGSNDATDSTSAGYESGMYGDYAKSFDGVDDYLGLPTFGIFSPNNSYSILGWVQFDSTGGNPIFRPGAEYDLRFRHNVNGNQKLDYQSYDGSNLSNLTSNTSVSTSTPTHFAFTYDGAGTAEWYIDGSLDISGTVQQDYRTRSNENVLGQNGASTAFLDGALDQFTLHDKVVSSTEVNNHRNSGQINA